MNLSDITTRGWILALFIRDDGERFLLGDGWYDFKDGLQHFQPNTIASDIVELQGTDGQLLAGQVRRSTAQRFNGYIGDSTITKTEIEARRMAFLQFFQVRRSYDVIYIFPDGSSIKRERGYLVEAPSVPEMWQFYPEYSVALNFENVNYYEYAEDDEGKEIFAHSALVAISNSLKGGLIWDGNGAYSEALNWSGYETESGDYITLNDAIEDAPLTLTQLSGNAEQNALPSAYQAVEYIQSSGTQRIETDYIFTQGDYIEFKFAPMATGDVAMFGSYESGAMCELGLLNNEIRGNTASAGLGYTYTTGTTYTATNQNGQWSIGGTSFGWRRDTTTTLKSFIFARNYSDPASYKPSSMRLYSLLVKRSGATAYNFIPCYRKSDGVIGVYETVNGKFFANAGTGSFTKGNDTTVASQAIETVTGEQTVSVVGKNLLSIPTGTHSSSAVTWTITDSTISASGTATATWSELLARQNFAIPLSAGTYTFSIPQALPQRIQLVLYEANNTTHDFNIYEGSTYVTCTTTYTTVAYRIVYRANSSAVSLSFPNELMMEQSATPTTFSPYQGQSYEINLGGTNLVNQSELTAGYVQSNGYPTVTQTQAEMRTGYLEVEPNTTYTFSIQATTDTYSPWFGWCEYTGQTPTTVIGSRQVVSSNPATFTTSATAKYVILSARNLQNATKVQLEKRSTATPYVPFVTYAYELAKVGTYQDRIYKDSGKWYIEKQIGKVVLDSSNQSNWSVYQSGTPNWFYYWSTIQNALVGNAEALMSNYGSFNSIGATDTNQGIMIATNGLLRVRLGEELAIADWKAKVVATPMVVYYALATPTTTEITDETLLSQLNFIASLYGGVNHISIVPSAGAQGTMTVQYATELLPGGGYVWEEGDTGGVTNVNVIGVANAQPIWTVTGPAVDPTLTNITTGQAITWTGTVPNNQTLVVDMGKQTAELNGANVYSGISGDWIDLKIGQNKLTYSAIGGEIPPSKIEWNGVVG